MSDDVPFWKRKRLGEMTPEEWESLCDGCGKCCLLKVEYEDTGEIEATSVACKLLDLKTCQCGDYVQRRRHVPDCIDLANIPDLRKLAWLPSTCAYKLLAEGKELYWWHYLVSGSRSTVHEAGISVRNKAISEEDVGDLDRNLQRYVVDWTL